MDRKKILFATLTVSAVCGAEAQQKSEHPNILFILTDGQPNDVTATRKALTMAHKIGLEVYGLGILDDSIRKLLPVFSRSISDLMELPVVFFEMFGKSIIGTSTH